MILKVGKYAPNLDAWTVLVKLRDNYTCQSCGHQNFIPGDNSVHAHHILTKSEHPESKLKLSNGITLCERCHVKARFHNGNGASGQERQ